MTCHRVYIPVAGRESLWTPAIITSKPHWGVEKFSLTRVGRWIFHLQAATAGECRHLDFPLACVMQGSIRNNNYSDKDIALKQNWVWIFLEQHANFDTGMCIDLFKPNGCTCFLNLVIKDKVTRS